MPRKSVPLEFIISGTGMKLKFGTNMSDFGKKYADFPEPLDVPNVTVPLWDLRQIEAWLKENMEPVVVFRPKF